jgi:hypothetical protein
MTCMCLSPPPAIRAVVGMRSVQVPPAGTPVVVWEGSVTVTRGSDACAWFTGWLYWDWLTQACPDASTLPMAVFRGSVSAANVAVRAMPSREWALCVASLETGRPRW